MIPASLYFPIYIVFTFLLIVFSFKKNSSINLLSPQPSSNSLKKSIFIGCLIILFFGLRPTQLDLDFGEGLIGDTRVYAAQFDKIAQGIFPENKDLINEKGGIKWEYYLFNYIRNFMAVSGFSINAWFIVVACIYIIPTIFAYKIITPRYVFVGLLFWMVNLNFYGMGVNGLKSGDAASIFLLGLAFLVKYKEIIAKTQSKYLYLIMGLLFVLGSYLFHSSQLMAIVAIIGALTIVRSPYMAITIWLLCILWALVSGNSFALFANNMYQDDRLEEYIDTVGNFRWDFLIYSAFPIFFGYYTIIRRGIKDRIYEFIYNTYILTNSIFILFIYSDFPNRFAAVSWSIMPILLYYPLVKYNFFPNKENTIAGYMLFGQLALLLIIN